MPKPEKTFRAGSITASVWAACRTENGEVIKRYTVRIQRSYKKDGTWKNTHVLFANDLPNVALDTAIRVAAEALCRAKERRRSKVAFSIRQRPESPSSPVLYKLSIDRSNTNVRGEHDKHGK